MILASIFTALRSLVADRAYPLIAPAGSGQVGDYIVYTPAGGLPQNTMSQGPNGTQLRLQVDVYSLTAAAAWTLNGSDIPQSGVNAALFAAFGALAISAPALTFEEDTKLYRVSQDFHLFY